LESGIQRGQLAVLSRLLVLPLNTVLAGYLQKTYGYAMTIANWMKVGVIAYWAMTVVK
jgi:hypothetical protein